jgi:hypothetical protein
VGEVLNVVAISIIVDDILSIHRMKSPVWQDVSLAGMKIDHGEHRLTIANMKDHVIAYAIRLALI